MTGKVEDQIRIRLIREFLDLIILRRLMDASSSGYDVMRYLVRRHIIYLSPGIIYSTLYSLEREGLVEAKSKGKKRLYFISKKGKSIIKEYQGSLDRIIEFAAEFFRDITATKEKEESTLHVKT